MVTDWLKEHERQIEVFHLPACSPELNPDKYLNGDLKGKDMSQILIVRRIQKSVWF